MIQSSVTEVTGHLVWYGCFQISNMDFKNRSDPSILKFELKFVSVTDINIYFLPAEPIRS